MALRRDRGNPFVPPPPPPQDKIAFIRSHPGMNTCPTVFSKKQTKVMDGKSKSKTKTTKHKHMKNDFVRASNSRLGLGGRLVATI